MDGKTIFARSSRASYYGGFEGRHVAAKGGTGPQASHRPWRYAKDGVPEGAKMKMA